MVLFLVREGIDSISLNPDTVVSTKKRIAYVEKTLGKKGNKTHKVYLGLVSILAILSAGLILSGGGCNPFYKKDKGENKRGVGLRFCRA